MSTLPKNYKFGSVIFGETEKVQKEYKKAVSNAKMHLKQPFVSVDVTSRYLKLYLSS